MLYRICTENVNYGETIKIIGKYFDGFTVLCTTGFWQGKPEHSLVIEIIVHDVGQDYLIEKLAYAIKKANKQESVLIQKIECETRFI